jgi:hypothetical protein
MQRGLGLCVVKSNVATQPANPLSKLSLNGTQLITVLISNASAVGDN